MSARRSSPRLSWVAISIGAFCQEKNIIADTLVKVSFPYKDNRGP